MAVGRSVELEKGPDFRTVSLSRPNRTLVTFLIERISGQPEPFRLFYRAWTSYSLLQHAYHIRRPPFSYLLTISTWPITMALCSLTSVVWFVVENNKSFVRCGAKKMMRRLVDIVFASVPAV
ncbi:hypothetical protein QBC45DRAFT_434881 [Copromyces sp. CBS 386.78]|nr:hypothetical protein QBC45DRAFT_434881 [Copromyces sp. CBS 386.78]